MYKRQRVKAAVTVLDNVIDKRDTILEDYKLIEFRKHKRWVATWARKHPTRETAQFHQDYAPESASDWETGRSTATAADSRGPGYGYTSWGADGW